MPAIRRPTLAAASGILFCVTVAIALLISPGHPGPGAPTQEIAAYFTEHRDKTLVEIYVAGLAMVPGMWLLGVLYSVLRRAEGEDAPLSVVALIGGTVAVTVNISASAFHGALAFMLSEPVASSTVRLLFDSGFIALAFTAFPLSVLVGATSAVVLRTGVLPRWFGVGGVPLAIAQLVASTGMFTTDGVLAPNGPISIVSLLGLLVWALGLTVALVRGAAGGTRHLPADAPARP